MFRSKSLESKDRPSQLSRGWRSMRYFIKNSETYTSLRDLLKKPERPKASSKLWNAFIRAMRQEDIATLHQIVSCTDIIVDVNIRDVKQTTPLHVAVREDLRQSTLFLLEEGAEVDARDHNGFTPLMTACYRGFFKIAQLLLRHGAKIEATDPNGYTPLIWAANGGKANLVKLLLDKGANIEAKDVDGYSALLIAIGRNHYRVAELLLEEGADIATTDKFGNNCIKMAQHTNNHSILPLLIEFGALDDILEPFVRSIPSHHPQEAFSYHQDHGDRHGSVDMGYENVYDSIQPITGLNISIPQESRPIKSNAIVSPYKRSPMRTSPSKVKIPSPMKSSPSKSPKKSQFSGQLSPKKSQRSPLKANGYLKDSPLQSDQMKESQRLKNSFYAYDPNPALSEALLASSDRSKTIDPTINDSYEVQTDSSSPQTVSQKSSMMKSSMAIAFTSTKKSKRVSFHQLDTDTSLLMDPSSPETMEAASLALTSTTHVAAKDSKAVDANPSMKRRTKSSIFRNYLSTRKQRQEEKQAKKLALLESNQETKPPAATSHATGLIGSSNDGRDQVVGTHETVLRQLSHDLSRDEDLDGLHHELDEFNHPKNAILSAMSSTHTSTCTSPVTINLSMDHDANQDALKQSTSQTNLLTKIASYFSLSRRNKDTDVASLATSRSGQSSASNSAFSLSHLDIDDLSIEKLKRSSIGIPSDLTNDLVHLNHEKVNVDDLIDKTTHFPSEIDESLDVDGYSPSASDDSHNSSFHSKSFRAVSAIARIA